MSRTHPRTEAAVAGAPTALDVGELPLSKLPAFVRDGTAHGPLHLERRGDRTYLVVDGATRPGRGFTSPAREPRP